MIVEQYSFRVKGVDQAGITHEYEIYNTLDYAIRIGNAIPQGSDKLEPIYVVPIHTITLDKPEEMEMTKEYFQESRRLEHLINQAKALRELTTENFDGYELRANTNQFTFDWKNSVVALDESIPRVPMGSYDGYSAKDRFLVPLETYALYTNMVDQNIRVHESLICTHPAIYTYQEMRSVLPSIENEKYKGVIDFTWDDFSGKLIFGQHE